MAHSITARNSMKPVTGCRRDVGVSVIIGQGDRGRGQSSLLANALAKSSICCRDRAGQSVGFGYRIVMLNGDMPHR